MRKEHEHGPFGHYPKGTTGHVLNALVRFGIPLTKVEMLDFTGKKADENAGFVLKYRGLEYMRYKYFECFDDPLFLELGEANPSQVTTVKEGGGTEISYKLVLDYAGNPSINVGGSDYSYKLYMILNEIFDERNEVCDTFLLRMNANAIWYKALTRDNDPKIAIEFWKPEGAQAFVDYLAKRMNA